MQLGKFTDYGLRVLIHLGNVAPDRLSVGTIAQTFGLSEHHLAKICSRLVRGGYLVAERGRGGGLRLAQPADEIRLGAVVRCLSEGNALVECFADGPCDCRIRPACGARGPLAEALQAFHDTLDRYTLADIGKHRRAELQALLAP